MHPQKRPGAANARHKGKSGNGANHSGTGVEAKEPFGTALTAEEIARRLGGAKLSSSGWWNCYCPAHDDDNPSFGVKDVEGGVLFKCHAGCSDADVQAALEKLRADWERDAERELRQRSVVARYDYRDEDGKLRYEVARYEPKAFRQRRPDGKGSWVWKMDGVEPLPYRLADILDYPDDLVFVVEGEKDVNAVAKIDLTATCNHGGAGKWRPEISHWLRGRRVVILPDNDEAGRKHAEDVAAKLHGIAGSIKVLELPDLPAKGDVSDWLEAGGTRKKLLRLAKAAPEWQAGSTDGRPDLLINKGDLPATVREARDHLARADFLFDRGGPVKIVPSLDGGPPRAVRLTRFSTVEAIHRVARPVELRAGAQAPVTFPDRGAAMYLDMVGQWNLPPLAGVTGAPILGMDGEIRTADGYDQPTGLWCTKVPTLDVPERPSRAEAEVALLVLRQEFRTFPFADAPLIADTKLGATVVDLDERPARDESAFLVGLLTAVCRASLWLAPGLLITAPAISGAGTGKGLLCRAISVIAFGKQPPAFSAGHDKHELDKRLVAELVGASAMVFLDNCNATTLRSDTLASVMTERPSKVRILGKSEMVPLNCAAFVAVTGNALTPGDDLVRRFLYCGLDARMENPESRDFAPGFLQMMMEGRAMLLSAALTIWRWGRHNIVDIPKGKPFGSFETWAEWVRDPLVELGCADPVARLAELKAVDPTRQQAVAFLAAWYERYASDWVKLHGVTDEVFDAAGFDENATQQRKRRYIQSLTGTRIGGWTMERQDAVGRWGKAEYRVRNHDKAENGCDK